MFPFRELRSYSSLLVSSERSLLCRFSFVPFRKVHHRTTKIVACTSTSMGKTDRQVCMQEHLGTLRTSWEKERERAGRDAIDIRSWS